MNPEKYSLLPSTAEPPFSIQDEADKIVQSQCVEMARRGCADYEVLQTGKADFPERMAFEINKSINFIIGPRGEESDKLYEESKVRFYRGLGDNYAVSIGKEIELPNLREPMRFRKK